MDIKNNYDTVIFTSAAALTIKDALIEALSKKIDLQGADLRGADLRGADLRDEDLRDADLRGADLRGADLQGADLQGADLQGAHLRGADLQGADLRDEDLRGADLQGADLRGADLQGAELQGADLQGVIIADKKVVSIRVFSGLYAYEHWAVLYEDGSRWVRMGCLFKSLEDWDKIGIRKSNLQAYPDDGSDQSEDRVAAFEFAKAAVLRMKAT
jgi:hypothetical protein